MREFGRTQDDPPFLGRRLGGRPLRGRYAVGKTQAVEHLDHAEVHRNRLGFEARQIVTVVVAGSHSVSDLLMQDFDALKRAQNDESVCSVKINR